MTEINKIQMIIPLLLVALYQCVVTGEPVYLIIFVILLMLQAYLAMNTSDAELDMHEQELKKQQRGFEERLGAMPPGMRWMNKTLSSHIDKAKRSRAEMQEIKAEIQEVKSSNRKSKQ